MVPLTTRNWRPASRSSVSLPRTPILRLWLLKPRVHLTFQPSSNCSRTNWTELMLRTSCWKLSRSLTCPALENWARMRKFNLITYIESSSSVSLNFIFFWIVWEKCWPRTAAQLTDYPTLSSTRLWRVPQSTVTTLTSLASPAWSRTESKSAPSSSITLIKILSSSSFFTHQEKILLLVLFSVYFKA